MRILDSETAPAHAGGSRRNPTTIVRRIARYYQLTHDYLVPSIREWLRASKGRRGVAGRG